uniref:CSON008873 protein n=1 Tax=Culicoides sonorensis TaxID=179676 RepID=A0A336M4Q2_CULSO
MSPTPKYSRSDVDNAIQLVKSGSSVNFAAKVFKIPETSLRHIIKSNNLKGETETSHNQTVLTKKEEQDLYNWILECSKAGFPRSTKQIVQQAYEISVKYPRSKGFPSGRPSFMWLRRFLKRCGNLHRKKIVHVSINSAAKTSVNEVDIRAYHNRVSTYLEENGLYHILSFPNRIAVADESYLGFSPRPTTVDQNRQKAKKSTKIDPKTHLTVLFTALANGNLMDSYIVYPYERLPKEIREEFPNQSMCFGKSESGWMNGELFLHYLKNVVVKHLEQNQVERPFILFVDGHSSQIGLEVIEYCKLQDIILISLYANATWLIQPLDIGVFGPLQTMWDEFLCNTSFALSYRSFAHFLKGFIEEKANVLAPFIIKAFEDTGIFPWNCDAIRFDKLLELCRMRKDIPGKELNDDTRIIDIEELDTATLDFSGLITIDGQQSPTDNQSDNIDPTPCLTITDSHNISDQPEGLKKSAPRIKQEGQKIVCKPIEFINIEDQCSTVMENQSKLWRINLPYKKEFFNETSPYNDDNSVLEFEDTDMIHSDDEDSFPSTSMEHHFSEETVQIFDQKSQKPQEFISPTLKEKNKYVLDTVLKHCESMELKQDLLNGTVDRNKDYGVDTLNILIKIIQEMKEPGSAPVQKRLRPEVSAENIEEGNRIKTRKIETFKSKGKYADTREMKNQQLHELRIKLTDLKCKASIIEQEIRRLNQLFKTKGHEGLTPDEFKQKQEKLCAKKNEIFSKIDQTKIDMNIITEMKF